MEPQVLVVLVYLPILINLLPIGNPGHVLKISKIKDATVIFVIIRLTSAYLLVLIIQMVNL